VGGGCCENPMPADVIVTANKTMDTLCTRTVSSLVVDETGPQECGGRIVAADRPGPAAFLAIDAVDKPMGASAD